MFEITASLFVINTMIVVIKRFGSVFEILHHSFDKAPPNENVIYVLDVEKYRLEDTMYRHLCILYVFYIC